MFIFGRIYLHELGGIFLDVSHICDSDRVTSSYRDATTHFYLYNIGSLYIERGEGRSSVNI